MKICSKCKQEKSVTEFHKHQSSKDGLNSWCKSCASKKAKQYYYENHEKSKEHRKVYNREVGKFKRYGLNREVFDEMLIVQNNKCAACSRSFEEFLPVIDHDHSCCPGSRSCGNCVRGLLCNRCNVVSGNAQDDPNILRQIADYLEKPC